MKIFGKTLKEYLKPIKYYIAGAILVVISQYAIALPLSSQYPWVLNLTQALWALMVALSILKLVKEHDFGTKNILVVGILYSIIIHGLKVSIRFFFYGKTIAYVIDRLLYGSFLVMAITIPLAILLPYLKKKKQL